MKYLYLAIFLAPLFVFSQNQNRFNFEQVNNLRVYENGDSLINAWAGGINFVQVNMMDMDGDQIEDLVLFDRSGNRIIPFLVKNNNGTKRFKYAPEYIEKFPTIESWMVLADYNCDGRKDLFVSTRNGIGLYRNDGVMDFVWGLNGPHITSRYSPTSPKVNLFVSPEDYPAIVDVDNDGDLDIFTFGMGNTVEHHENSSNCGLDFEVRFHCWGGFKEDGVTNKVTLDACNGHKKDPGYTNNTQKTQHAGSTLLLLDLEGNGLMDCVIGDVSFPNGIGLYNDGKPDSAHMYKQDTTFPSYDSPVDQYIYPAFFYEDVDFDGKKDFLASPFTDEGSQNTNSLWLYKDISGTSIPDFNFKDSAFIQKDVIDLGSAAAPQLIDINGDGLLDVIISNYGVFESGGDYFSSISYYKNTGSKSTPVFTLQSKNYGDLGDHNLGNAIHPAFGDVDGDNDLDIFMGAEDGAIHYFENNPSAGQNVYTLKTPNYGGIDVGNFSTPTLFDIDGDSDLDLFIGNELGTIVHYENTGSATSPNYKHITDNYGGVTVRSIYQNRGYSVPFFHDHNGRVDLFVGSYDKGVVQYDSIDFVESLPSSIQADFLDGSTPNMNHKVSPFGLTKKAGRNQILFKASELRAKGMVYGYINSISLNILNTGLPNIAYDGLYVRFKNVQKDSLTGFESGMTDAYYSITVMSKGWLPIPLQTPFLWDGSSDLLIEFCFKNQYSNIANAEVEFEDVGYKANAFGDGTGSVNGTDGCNLAYAGNSNLRPNMKFIMTPAFTKTDVLWKEGSHNAPSLADLNDDGYLDLVIGNYSGGVTLYEGVEFSDIGMNENDLKSSIQLTAYPNPTKNSITLEWDHSFLPRLDITVLDLSGRIVHQGNYQSGDEISLNHLPDGMYMINAMQNHNFVGQFKLIKMNE